MRRRLYVPKNRRAKTRLSVPTLPSLKMLSTQKWALWGLLALCAVAAVWFAGSHLVQRIAPEKKAAIAGVKPLKQPATNPQPVLDPDQSWPKIITFAQADPANPERDFPTEPADRAMDEENLAKTEQNNPPPDSRDLHQTVVASPHHADRLLAERERKRAESKRSRLEKEYRKGLITAEAYQAGQEEYRSAIEKYRKSLKGNAQE